MTLVPRIVPRRPSVEGRGGIKRVVLTNRLAGIATSGAPKAPRLAADPHQWVMAVAYSDRGAFSAYALQAIAAAALLSDAVTGVVAVSLGALDADLSAAGADAIQAIPDCPVSRYEPDRHLAALCALIDMYQPQHIFLPDSTTGEADLGRRLIAKLGGDGVCGVRQLDSEHVLSSCGPGATARRQDLPRVVLLCPGVVDLELPFRGLGKTMPESEPVALNTAYRNQGIVKAEPSAVALEEADMIVASGHGVKNVATAAALANMLGAATGASRVAVDEGKFPRDKQIGASGKTVSATTYFAVGISGAVQHLQGIKDCNHVIAINSDAGAPIAKRADLMIAGDAEEVMQALIKRLGEARAQSPSGVEE